MAETKAKNSNTARTAKKADSGKEKNSSVGKTSKEILDKGLEASKKWFESAKKTISEWGDEGVKQVELVKLNSKMEKGYAALGRIAYAKLSKKGASVSASDEEIGDIVKLLSDMARKIKKLGGVPAKSSGKEEVKALPAKSSSAKKKTSVKKADEAAAEKSPARSRKTASSGKAASKKTEAKKSAAKSTSGKKSPSKRTSSRAKKSEE